MIEIWKDIEGYEGLYQVSNFGLVKSLPKLTKNNHISKEKILKPIQNESGYFSVVLYKNKQRKRYKIHRLVAITFLNNTNNYCEVNHKDENKSNNHVNNLEWCSRKYNMTYGNILEKKSNSMKGKKFSEATKKKMRESQIIAWQKRREVA